MVKKFLLASIVSLILFSSSGCISSINSYRSNSQLKAWEDLAHKRQYDKAEKAIESALAHDPENIEAWTALGDIYLITEGYVEARYAYEEALRLDRHAFGAYTGLRAVELEESGYSEEMKEKLHKEIESLIDIQTSYPELNADTQKIIVERLMAAFNLLNMLQEYDRASALTEEIMKLSPDEKVSKSLSEFLSEELIREKDAEARLKKSEHFLSIFPSARESFMVNHFRLAAVQKDIKDRELLYKMGEEWIQKDPDNRRANFSVGYWYTEEGIHLDKAITYLQKALNLINSPDYADKPDYYPDAEWLKDLEKSRGTYYSVLGLAYSKLGEKGLAEDAYRKGTQYLQYDKDLYFRLGSLLEEKGNAEAAISAYAQALKSGVNDKAEERLNHLLNNPMPTKEGEGSQCHPACQTDLISGSQTMPGEEIQNQVWNDSPLYKYFAVEEGITTFTDITESAGLAGAAAIRVAWGDYNNDTFQDILLNGNTLYRNNGNGTFTNATAEAGITNTPGAKGGLWGDMDNDGFIDFYTFATGKGNRDRFWKNNNNNTFTDITPAAFTEHDTYPTEGAAWGDYDNDGFIDLYLANYEKPLYETIERGRGNPDRLFHNNGNGTFEEVSIRTGIKLRENMCGRGVSWADYDNDGDSDIYVSNYRLDPNLLWNNNGDGTFTNMAEGKGVEGYETEGSYGHSIGTEWGDYDNDGDLDLFVSNLAHPRYIGYSDKSMLLENQGPPDYIFLDRFGQSGIRFEETFADPSFIDYDNDGYLDIYVTSTYKDRKSYLYKGAGNGKFTDITWLAGVRVDDGWGNAFADYDNDGDLDLAVGGGEGLRLFRNDGNRNHWLHVHAVGSQSNHSAIGARVTIMPGRTIPAKKVFDLDDSVNTPFRLQIREVQGGKGSGSQHSLPAEFGLGNYDGPVDVEVRFPSGKIARLYNVAPDQTVVIYEAFSDEPS